jgi:hypothetical protein
MNHPLTYTLSLLLLLLTNVACTPFKKSASAEIKPIKVDLLHKPRITVKTPVLIPPVAIEKNTIVLREGVSQTAPIRQDTPAQPNELTGVYGTGQFMPPPINTSSPAEIRFQAVPEPLESTESTELKQNATPE